MAATKTIKKKPTKKAAPKKATKAAAPKRSVSTTKVLSTTKAANKSRSKTAMTADSSIRAKNTFTPPLTERQMKAWQAQPNRYDIAGVDAPAAKKKTIAKKRRDPPPEVKTRGRRMKSEQEKYAEYMELASDYNARKVPYHEDMTARLADDHYEEKGGWAWKRSETAAKKAYNAHMMDEYRMQTYNNKKAKPKRKGWSWLRK